MFKYLKEFRQHKKLILSLDSKDFRIHKLKCLSLDGKDEVHLKMLTDSGEVKLGLLSFYDFTIKEIKGNKSNLFSKRDVITLSVLAFNHDNGLRLILLPVHSGRRYLSHILELYESKLGYDIQLNGVEINPHIHFEVMEHTTLKTREEIKDVRISGYS